MTLTGKPSKAAKLSQHQDARTYLHSGADACSMPAMVCALSAAGSDGCRFELCRTSHSLRESRPPLELADSISSEKLLRLRRRFWARKEPDRLCPFYQRQLINEDVIVFDKLPQLGIGFVAIFLGPLRPHDRVRREGVDK